MVDRQDLKYLAVAALTLALCACDSGKGRAERGRDDTRASAVAASASRGGEAAATNGAPTRATDAPSAGAASGSASAPAGAASDPAASRALSGAPIEAQLTHNYVLARDGEYGYEAADKQRVVMVRYLGEKRGVYTAEIHKGEAVGQMSCRSPCDQILTRYFVAGKESKVEKTRNDGVSIAAAVFADAMSGQLRPYDAPRASR